LTPVVALELEFYLIHRQRAANGAPQPPRSPVTGEPEHSTQVYGMAELDDYRAFLDTLAGAAAVQELPADAAVSEYAPGQYEINLKHEPDAESACDHALQLKRLIRAVAREHGMEASFMAKPYPGLAGNGMHLHVSLVNDSGENVFTSEEPLGNPLLGHAAAGLATTMAEWMALFAPNVNAFRRFQPDSYVPLAPTYGYNNRTLALRVPSGHAPARRIEHRVAGADANPFLLMAAVLAGMHHGLTQQLPPPEPVSGNAYATVAPGLPLNWLDALRRFEASTLAPEYFGERFCAAYVANKDEERRTFEEQVTALEYAWYLRTV
jgi:glutamine synthetase